MPATKLTFPRLKTLLHNHLEDTVGRVTDFEVTFAKLERGAWKATIEFVVKGGREDAPQTATFLVDADTREILEFRKGSMWKE